MSLSLLRIRAMPQDSTAPSRFSRHPIHEEVVGCIRDMIVEGELLAGTHVPERTICEKLGISRTPLREAYKVLASEGLLTLLPNRGAVVTRLSMQDVEDILGMLGVLEGLAAERACARITDAEIEDIEALHRRMVGHYERGELSDYFKSNQAVHDAIVAAAGSLPLLQTHRGLAARVRRFRFAGNVETNRWERAVREHEAILMALKDRDTQVLTAMLRAHLRNGWRIVRQRNRDELDVAAA
jgi:DNA-binding GntR family transcriptional regulator